MKSLEYLVRRPKVTFIKVTMSKARRRRDSKRWTHQHTADSSQYMTHVTRVPPIVRFRRYVRLTLICIRLFKTSYKSLKDSGEEFLSVLQVSEEYGAVIDRRGLIFDPKHFKANTEERLGQEARRLLQMDPRERTETDLQYLVIILCSIPAFAEYPRRMQHRLCEVGWYETYEPKRAVIREGHPPHAFYFIISGTVIVTTHEGSSTRTLVSLNRGMSFGELAVITRRRRQATVSTQTETELLCISVQDFTDIFMSGGLQNLNDPDHNSFIRSIGFLRQWPVDCLSENPEACMFHYFNRGQVLVRDSNNSDWIYIVKTGSLSVLKKLRQVQPANAHHDEKKASKRKRSKMFGTADYSLRTRSDSRQHEEILTTRSEPDLHVYRNQFEMEKQLERTLPGYNKPSDRLGLIDYDAIIKEHQSRLMVKNPDNNTQLPSINIVNNNLSKNDSEREKPQEEPLRLPPIPGATQDNGGNNLKSSMPRPITSKTAKGVYLAASPLGKVRNAASAEEGVTNRSRQTTQDDIDVSEDKIVGETLAKLQLEYERKFLQREGRKTIAEELDSKGQRDFVFTEADLHPMYIMVQVLERGQYFGVSNMVYPEQPSLYLVSNGAECIVISKKFFLEKASEASMRYLRQTECPFPTDDYLQKNLQDYVNWKAHRAKMYRRLVKRKLKRDAMKKQFLPQYEGQYCFRTGPI
ncbi:uncharacterized protein LOC121378215 [Gigantopelta aegis]|uniref:uncharacterized protein LOC121378215 n=1 Tax=Gigantopelta aegis TaxID=1735272 RepID=UPI001B88ABEB|nr:uncharacterized protein LOC121378215 [Gigantopelta aegis]